MSPARPVSRRALLGGAGAALGLTIAGGAAPSAAADASDANKIDQPTAKYQDHPKGQQRCAICLNFEPPGACKIVRGAIVANGWCQFFAARENAH